MAHEQVDKVLVKQQCCFIGMITYLMYSLLFVLVTLISDPPGLRSFTVTYKH